MPVRGYFQTLIYAAPLTRAARDLNARLLHECRQLELDDDSGRRWSKQNYPGGYTSYNSASRMHQLSPTFAKLGQYLKRHVDAFARALEFDLEGRELTMT